MSELLLDIMATMNVDSVSFCLNDLIVLLMHSQVKVEKHQVRKVVQECWKLTPAPNGLTYTTYQGNYNTIRSLRQNETLSTFIVAIMSSNNSDISISNRLRLLRIILCNASVCNDEGLNHIRLSLSVDNFLLVRKWRKAGISAFRRCRKLVSSDCKRFILRTQ